MALTGGSAAWKALGLGSGDGGGLEKLKIRHETEVDKWGRVLDWGEFHVLFNPSKLVFKREVTWKPQELATKGFQGRNVKLDFVRAVPETLALSLFFDTYEGDEDGGLAGAVSRFVVPANPFTSAPTPSDVRLHTLQLAELAKIHAELHQPPRCELWWGKRRLFLGVLTQLDQRFTMFMPNGTPVRATVDCVFTEYNTVIDAVKRYELQSSDVAKTVVMTATDSLMSIAAAEYNDPAQWRVIAKANGIANPRAVPPGTVLTLPPLS